MCIDPLLWALSEKIVVPKLGRIGACADDIEHCGGLEVLPTFCNVSGMALSPRKCIMILCSIVCSEQNIACIRRWLSDHCPAFATFEITNHATYLGICIGPVSKAHLWKGAMLKYKAKVDQINLHADHPKVALGEYSSKAVPTLGYIAQLALPPKGLRRFELSALTKVLRMATNSLSLDAIFFLRQLLNFRVFFL